MKLTERQLNERIQEEIYIYLIEQELKKSVFTEAKEYLFPRIDNRQLYDTAQKDKHSDEAKVMSRYITTTDPQALRYAEEEGLAQMVYQMSNQNRQYLFDQGGSISNVQDAQLKAADERYEDQIRGRGRTPVTTEPVPIHKTSASDQPASTSGQLQWFLNRWRDFIESPSVGAEDFRAEVDRSREYLNGKSIIEFLQAFLSMIRNRYEHGSASM
jgi:hypothetical protein